MEQVSAGLMLEICRKRHMPGALVEVKIDTQRGQTRNPAAKFNGKTFRIDTRWQPKPTKPPQFTLVGCESEYGLPYWFIEEDLILL